MLRQRIRARTSPVAYLGRAVLVLLCLILLWYGLMLVLLAAKVSPDFVNAISGYRSVYDHLASIGTANVTDSARLIVGVSGLLAFLLFGYLAYKELPRPYLARNSLALAADARGQVTVSPRAIERVAESAALGQPAVSGAAGRYGRDEMTVNVRVDRAGGVLEALRDVRTRVSDALVAHDLPTVPVRVTLTGFDRQRPREYQ
jgi:hypothetical protein